MNIKENITHSSFGQIRFCRVNGKANFYGSELEQDNYISMTINNSETIRELSQDRYYMGNNIIRIRMTSNQFAEMITSLNNGGGVPCTIERVTGKKIEDLPQLESRKEFVHRNFELRMKEFADNIESNKELAKNIINKKTLSKKDMEDLIQKMDWISQEIKSNIPFFLRCFQETMDEVIVEAKTEIESAIQHKISTLGLDALHKHNKLLSDAI